MPIDLAQVDWLYVVVLAVFAYFATFVGNLLTFNHRGAGAVLSALLFVALFVFWTYYPHRVPLLPRTLAPASTATPAPAAPAAPAAPQKPRNPVTDITPPRNPVTDVTPPAAPATPPAAPAR
jgi:hypothetical protein